MKCKDCEHLRIEIPDKLNEGHAYCLKYDLSTMLVGSHYKSKIESLECYADTEECVHKEKVCEARKERCEYEDKYGHCTLNECAYGDFLVVDDSRFDTGRYCFCNGITDKMKEMLKEQNEK